MWRMLGRIYDGLITSLGLFAGAVFAAMAVGIGVDVAMRNLAGSGVGWMIELMEYGMLVATMLAAPWVLREGAHVTVDIVVSRAPPTMERVMRTASSLLGLSICAAMVWYGWQATALAMQRGSMVIKAVVFPEWWLLALVPVGMALLSIEFVRLGWQALQGLPARADASPGTTAPGKD